jgi:NTP pyrophosphatase (non-canonical NTP hydrolase)
MNSSFEILEQRVLTWAQEKGILEKATSQTQLLKMFEEMGEMSSSLLKNKRELLIDAVGDSLVCLVIFTELENINLYEALESVLGVIEARQGEMVDGVFVKKEDLC